MNELSLDSWNNTTMRVCLYLNKMGWTNSWVFIKRESWIKFHIDHESDDLYSQLLRQQMWSGSKVWKNEQTYCSKKVFTSPYTQGGDLCA